MPRRKPETAGTPAHSMAKAKNSAPASKRSPRKPGKAKSGARVAACDNAAPEAIVETTGHADDQVAPRKRAPCVWYSEEIALKICEHIALGRSLRSFCEQPDAPALGSVHRWLADNPTFREQYARAREDQADSYADQIIDIADREPDSNKARVRIDARKWVASKLKPKKYGDKLGLSGDGDGAPIQHSIRISWMTESEARENRGWA